MSAGNTDRGLKQILPVQECSLFCQCLLVPGLHTWLVRPSCKLNRQLMLMFRSQTASCLIPACSVTHLLLLMLLLWCCGDLLLSASKYDWPHVIALCILLWYFLERVWNCVWNWKKKMNYQEKKLQRVVIPLSWVYWNLDLWSKWCNGWKGWRNGVNCGGVEAVWMWGVTGDSTRVQQAATGAGAQVVRSWPSPASPTS